MHTTSFILYHLTPLLVYIDNNYVINDLIENLENTLYDTLSSSIRLIISHFIIPFIVLSSTHIHSKISTLIHLPTYLWEQLPKISLPKIFSSSS